MVPSLVCLEIFTGRGVAFFTLTNDIVESTTCALDAAFVTSFKEAMLEG